MKITDFASLDRAVRNMVDSRFLGTFQASAFNAGVTTLFSDFFGAGAIAVQGTRAPRSSGTNVVFSGKLAAPWYGIANLNATCTFRWSGGVRLEIALTGFPPNWKFSDCFDVLKNQAIDEFEFSNVTFTLTAAPSGAALQGTLRQKLGLPAAPRAITGVFKKGLSFAGTLNFQALPALVRSMMPGAPVSTLQVQGAMELVTTGTAGKTITTPIFFLTGAPRWDYTLLSQKLSLQLQFLSFLATGAAQRTAGVPDCYVAFVSSMNVTLKGKTQSFPLLAYSSSAQAEQLTLTVSPPPNTTAVGLGDLDGLIGFKKPTDLIPAKFPALGKLYFNRLTIQLDLARKTTTALFVRIGWGDAWKEFNDTLILSDKEFQFSILSPESSTPFFGATLFLEATFGPKNNTISLKGSVLLPDFYVSLYLPEGNSVNIKSLLQGLSGETFADFPKMTCTQFGLYADLSADSYTLSATLQENWTVNKGGTFSFTLKSIRAVVSRSSGQTTLNLVGDCDLNQQLLYKNAGPPDVGIQLSAGYQSGAGWQLGGYTLPGQKISLALLFSHLGDRFGMNLAGAVPQGYLSNLNADVQTKPAGLAFGGAISTGQTDTLTILGKSFDFTAFLNLDHTGGKTTGSVSGYFTLKKDFTIAVEYDITTAAKTVLMAWRYDGKHPATFKDFLQPLGLSVPSGAAGELSKVSLKSVLMEYDVTTETFIMAAETEKSGTAFVEIGEIGGQKGFIVGYKVSLTQLKSLVHLPSGIQIVQNNDVALIFSTADDPNFSIPQIPVLTGAKPGALGQASGTAFPLSAGLSFVIDIDLSGTKNKAFARAGDLAGGAGNAADRLTGLLSLDPKTRMVSIAFQLSGTLKVGSNKMELSNPRLLLKFSPSAVPLVELRCTTLFDLGGKQTRAMAQLAISATEMQGSIDVSAQTGSLPDLLGLPGLHLKSLGAEFGVFFDTGGVDFGMTAAFTVGPSNAKYKTDNRKGYDRFALIMSVEEEVPNIDYASFYLREISLGETISVFTDKQPPAALQAVNATDVSFYFCEQPTSLPDGQYAQPGFGFSALLDIFGFEAFAVLEVSPSEGIHGRAQMDPIHYPEKSKHALIAITCDPASPTPAVERNQIKGRTVSNAVKKHPGAKKQAIVHGGGPELEISSSGPEFLYASWHLSIFGLIGSSVLVEIDERGATFQFSDDVDSFATASLDCTLKIQPSFYLSITAEYVLKLDLDLRVPLLDKIPGLNPIKLDSDLEAEVNITVDNGVEVELSASFDFDGHTLHLPKFKLNVPFSDFKDLKHVFEKKIADEADDLFKDILGGLEQAWDDTEKVADDIKKGAVKAVKDIKDGAEHAAKDIKDKVDALASGAVKDAKKARKAIDAEAAAAERAGKAAVQTIGRDATAAVSAIDHEGKKLVGDAKKAIAAAKQGLDHFVSNAKKTIKHLAASLKGDIRDVEHDVARAAGKVIHTLENGYRDFKHAAEAAIHGLERLGKSVVHDAKKALADVKKAIGDAGKLLKNLGHAIDHVGRMVAHALVAYFFVVDHDFAAAKRLLESIASSVARFGGKLFSDLGHIGADIKNAVDHAIHSAEHAVSHFFHDVGSDIKKGWHKFTSLF